jgi:hypothetical protein
MNHKLEEEERRVNKGSIEKSSISCPSQVERCIMDDNPSVSKAKICLHVELRLPDDDKRRQHIVRLDLSDVEGQINLLAAIRKGDQNRTS